jgi:ATP-dependent Lon protease
MSDIHEFPGWQMTGEDETRETPVLGPQPASDLLVILPVRGTVLFPGMVMPLTVGRKRSVAAAQQAMRDKISVGIIMQRNEQMSEPAASDLHAVGTIASILRYVTTPDGTHHLVCQGQRRFRVREVVQEQPFMLARIDLIEEPDTQSPEIEARFVHLKQLASEALDLLPQAPPELVAMLQAIMSPVALADLAAAHLDLKPEEKQEILETTDLASRMDKVTLRMRSATRCCVSPLRSAGRPRHP